MRGFSQSIKHKKKTMSFCSFASLLGGACGASSENPNVADFVMVADMPSNQDDKWKSST